MINVNEKTLFEDLMAAIQTVLVKHGIATTLGALKALAWICKSHILATSEPVIKRDAA